MARSIRMMKVLVKRDFKSYFLLSPKKQKCRQALHEIFFNFQYKCTAGASTSKICASLLCCPLFSKECLNSQTRINIIVKKDNVDSQPSHSSLPWRIILSYLDFLWFYLSPEYLFTMVGKTFMFFRLQENACPSQKSESRLFYCQRAPQFLISNPLVIHMYLNGVDTKRLCFSYGRITRYYSRRYKRRRISTFFM